LLFVLLHNGDVSRSGQALRDVRRVASPKLVDAQDVVALEHADECPVLKDFYLVGLLTLGEFVDQLPAAAV